MKLNGDLWSFGGIKDDTNLSEKYARATANVFAYNSLNDSWRSGPDMPHALWGQGGASAIDSAYLFGGAETNVFAGGNIVNTIYKFTPGSGWNELNATCPEAVYSVRAVTGPDGMIYVVGGATGAESQTDTDRIWRFDPSSESIESAQWATLPQPLRWVSCTTAEVDGTQYLYTFGGHSVSSGNIVSTVTRYPLSGSNAGSAETMTSAPTEFRQAVSDAKIDGKVYICYGHHDNSNFPGDQDWKNDVYRYDLANDSWDSDMPPVPNDGGRVAGPHGVFNGKLIVAGGHLKLYNENDAHDVKGIVDILSPASGSSMAPGDGSGGSGTLEREIHVGFQPTDGGSIKNGLILREGQTPRLIDENGNNLLMQQGGGGGSEDGSSGGSGSGFESIPTGGAGGDGTGIGQPGFDISNTVNAVQDLGMDPNGNQSINDALSSVDDGTEVVFPPGTYRVQPGDSGYKPGVSINGNDVWLRGQEGEQRDAVKFQLPAGKAGSGFGFTGSNVGISNATFDHSNHKATVFGIQVAGSGDKYFYNLQHIGRNLPSKSLGEPFRSQAQETNGKVHCWGFGLDSDGLAHIENYKWTDPETTVEEYPNGLIGMQAPKSMSGTVELVNNHMAWRSEHNVYASRCSGGIHVKGGYYHNSCNTNMRIEGKNSWMEDATIHVDMDPSRTPKAVRGLWWENNKNTASDGGHIGNCDFIYTSDTPNGSSIVTEFDAGAVTIKNCRFYHTNGKPACSINTGGVTFRNCSWTGSGDVAVSGNGDTEVMDSCNTLSGGFQNCNTTNISTSNCSRPEKSK